MLLPEKPTPFLKLQMPELGNLAQGIEAPGIIVYGGSPSKA